jgi:DedD protein
LQDQLKERLTGAAILVAVVVLLVPELFHGRPPAGTGAGASTAGPPVRSVTIDLGDGAATRPLTENAPEPPASMAPAANTPGTATVADPAASAATARPAANPVTPAVNAAATTTPPAPVANAPVANSPVANAKSASVRTTSPAPAAASSANSHAGAASGWTVQLGSFSRREFADRMVKDAAARGFTVVVAGPDDRGLYRVRSAPRPDRAAALALKQKMQASGFKPIVNKTP